MTNRTTVRVRLDETALASYDGPTSLKRLWFEATSKRSYRSYTTQFTFIDLAGPDRGRWKLKVRYVARFRHSPAAPASPGLAPVGRDKTADCLCLADRSPMSRVAPIREGVEVAEPTRSRTAGARSRSPCSSSASSRSLSRGSVTLVPASFSDAGGRLATVKTMAEHRHVGPRPRVLGRGGRPGRGLHHPHSLHVPARRPAGCKR